LWGDYVIKDAHGDPHTTLHFGSYLTWDSIESRFAGAKPWLRLVLLWLEVVGLAVLIRAHVMQWFVDICKVHPEEALWQGGASLFPGVSPTIRVLKIGIFAALIVLLPAAGATFAGTITSILHISVGSGSSVGSVMASAPHQSAPVYVQEMAWAVNQWFPLIESIVFPINYVLFLFTFDALASWIMARVRMMPI
jgi:hypothetical protein